MNIIDSIAEAITRQENVASVDPTANNPGALMDLPYYRATGEFRLARYSTIEDGMQAMKNTIASYFKQGYSLEGMFAKWAPSGHGANDPVTYAGNVSNWTGIPKNVPLNQITSQDVLNGGILSNPITPVNTASAVNPSNLEEATSNLNLTDEAGLDPTNGFTGGLGVFVGIGLGLFVLKLIFR